MSNYKTQEEITAEIQSWATVLLQAKELLTLSAPVLVRNRIVIEDIHRMYDSSSSMSPEYKSLSLNSLVIRVHTPGTDLNAWNITYFTVSSSHPLSEKEEQELKAVLKENVLLYRLLNKDTPIRYGV